MKCRINKVSTRAALCKVRRARGGYWGQVTAPLGFSLHGFFSRKRWVHVADNPSPHHDWTYFPWATKQLGNGYMDEWYFGDWTAMPISQALKRNPELWAQCEKYLTDNPP